MNEKESHPVKSAAEGAFALIFVLWFFGALRSLCISVCGPVLGPRVFWFLILGFLAYLVIGGLIVSIWPSPRPPEIGGL